MLAAGVSTRTATTPLITGTRLRGGSAGGTRGAASFITEQINVAAEAGVSGDLLVRADCSYYNGPVISAIDRAGAFFSITMRSDPKNRRAIAAIPADAWAAIRYPNAVYDEELRMWYSDAEVAEVPYTAFTSKKAHTTTGRMIVRRVRRLNPKNAEGQQALPGLPDEVTYRYHAVFTSNPHPVMEAEAEHRDHAVSGQIFADSTGGPLAHLPSGDFSANAAWVVLAAMTQNILRAAGDHRRGLTRPDPVTAPASGPPRPPRPLPPTRKDHRKAAQRWAAGPSPPQSPGETPRAEIGPKTIYRNSSVDTGSDEVAELAFLVQSGKAHLSAKAADRSHVISCCHHKLTQMSGAA